IFEHFPLIVFGNADAGVFDGDRDLTEPGVVRGGHGHGPGRRELERVAEQVEYDLLPLLAIRADRRHRAAYSRRDGQVRTLDDRLELGLHFLEKVTHAKRRRVWATTR